MNFNKHVIVILLSIILLCLIKENFAGKNFYRILGISRGATADQIKRAYRKLAIKYHPDRQPTEEAKKEAQKKFIEIAQAYEVLSDEKKRKIYDTYGEEGLKGQGGFGFHDPSSIFAQFFGDDFGGFRFSFGGFGDEDEDEESFRGQDLIIPLHVTLEDLYKGKVLTFKRVRTAHPEGAKPKKCQCRNKVIKMTYVNGVMKRVVENNCPECRNRFDVIQKTSELLVDIEAGMKDGEKLVFYGEGDATESTLAGDLVFVIKTAPHKTFEREGTNLKMKMKISLKEALVGFTRKIKHLDNRDVTIKIDKVIRPGQIEKIEGEGMPHHDNPKKKGDLFIEFDVEFPSSLTDKQKKALKEIL